LQTYALLTQPEKDVFKRDIFQTEKDKKYIRILETSPASNKWIV